MSKIFEKKLIFSEISKRKLIREIKVLGIALFALFVSLFFLSVRPQKVYAGTQEYTTGSGSWTAVVTGSVTAELWGGGGGGGGGGTGNGDGGGGGGGGQYVEKTVYVTSGSQYYYSVGTEGASGTGDGGAGGDSIFISSGTAVAKGGEGGLDYNSTPSGRGGRGSTSGGVGDTILAGGSGATGTGTNSGGGGGGAGSTGTGKDASGTTAGGSTPNNGGAGGNGTSANGANGSPGNDYGGAGGGGTRNSIGGSGASGYVYLSWSDPPITISGIIYNTSETSPYGCSTYGNLSVHLAINNVSGTYSGNCITDTGAWSIDVSGGVIGSGSTIVAYISGGTVHGSTVLISDGNDKNDVPIMQDRVVLRDDANGSITNTEIGNGDTSDSNDLVNLTGGSYMGASAYETHIYTSDAYVPGGNVQTGKLHVVGNFTGNSTLSLSGSGSGTSRPLHIDGGTFTAATTTMYTSGGAFDVEGTTYTNLSVGNGGGAGTLISSASITGNLTAAAGIFDLSTYTANRTTLGGTLTVNNGTTLKIGGTNPLPTNYQTLSFGATSTEEYSGTTQTVTSANYGNLTISGSDTKTLGGSVDAAGTLTVNSGNTLSTGFPSIFAFTVLNANINGGTLDITGSTFTITGSLGTLLTNTGTLTAGSGSTTKFTGAEPTALLSGSFTGDNSFFNLILSPSISDNISYPTGAAFTVASNLTITPQASSTYTLTVNLEGNASVTGTTTLTGTGSGMSDLNTGAYNLSSGTMTIGSPGTLTAPSSPALNVGGDLTITGTLTAPSGTAATSFTLGGDFLLTGSFVNSSGMLTLTGTDPSQLDYNNHTTFYKLYVSSSSAGKDIQFDEQYQTIIDNNITITGANCSGGRIYLDSIVNDNPWDINIKTGGTPNITYIDLEDANGSLSEVTPAATDSTETGTNTGWSVTAGACGGGGITLSGIIYNTSETSPYACNSTPLTVYLRVNNSGTYSAECTTSSGSWSVSGITVSSGSTIVAYISEVGTKGSTVLVSDASAKSDIPIMQGRVVLRDDANGSITNTEIGSGDTSDSDDLFTITSGSYATNDSAYETHIYTADTYAPAGGVSTGKLHIVGTFTGNTSLILSGTGSGSSRPLYVNGGTFTAPTTTTYTGAGSFDVEGTTYTSLEINNVNAIGTLTGAASIVSGNLTVTSGIFDLSTYTANRTGAGGTLTLSSGATLKIGGTGTLPTNFSTHSVDAASTVEYYGTTQTIGTINSGSYGNLTISGTGAKTLAGTEGVLGDLTISGGSFVDGGYQITGNASGILSTSAGTALVLGGGSTSTSFPTAFTSGNISLSPTSTVLYNSNQAQTISTTPSYGNLEIKPAANSLTDTLASGTLTVNGNLTIGNGTNNGDVVEATTYDPNISITGNVVVNTGTSFTNSDSTSATLNIDGNLTISGTFTAPRGTNDNSFTLAGNFIDSGSYVHNSGQITLDPSGSSVQLDYSSDTTFYQFSILSASAGKDIQFDETHKTIIANDITITGTNCTDGRVYLDSMVNDNPWDINIKTGATPNITYIDLEDANGSLSEVTPSANNSTETGTNTGWTVTSGACSGGGGPAVTTNMSGLNCSGVNIGKID